MIPLKGGVVFDPSGGDNKISPGVGGRGGKEKRNLADLASFGKQNQHHFLLGGRKFASLIVSLQANYLLVALGKLLQGNIV